MKKRTRLTKEQIEEGKQEFAYINDGYKDLLLEHFDIENYKLVYDDTEQTLEKIIFFDLSTRCFYKIHDNEDGTQPIITCCYRTDTEKLPQLVKIVYLKSGFKFCYFYKGTQFKTKIVYFRHFKGFVETFSSTINALKSKYLPNNCYC